MTEKTKTTIAALILLVVLSSMVIWFNYVNRIVSFKAVVISKSIDTLQYRCGYKNRYRCTGIFNRVHYKSKYGSFIEKVCKCEYEQICIGDSIKFSDSRTNLRFYYGLNIE